MKIAGPLIMILICDYLFGTFVFRNFRKLGHYHYNFPWLFASLYDKSFSPYFTSHLLVLLGQITHYICYYCAHLK